VPKYLVDTVSMFRLRYVIEAAEADHALDSVTLNQGELREFSQKHLDEVVSSAREIDDEEYLRLFDTDNDYLRGWPDDQKFEFVNIVE